MQIWTSRGSTFCPVNNWQHRLHTKNLWELKNAGHFGKTSRLWKGKEEGSCHLISLPFPAEFPHGKKRNLWIRVQVTPVTDQKSTWLLTWWHWYDCSVVMLVGFNSLSQQVYILQCLCLFQTLLVTVVSAPSPMEYVGFEMENQSSREHLSCWVLCKGRGILLWGFLFLS